MDCGHSGLHFSISAFQHFAISALSYHRQASFSSECENPEYQGHAHQAAHSFFYQTKQEAGTRPETCLVSLDDYTPEELVMDGNDRFLRATGCLKIK